MLFNSLVFIFAFLPVALVIFYLIGGSGRARLATGWLVIASLVFYGYWDARYLGLLVASTLVNFGLGRLLSGEGGPGKIPKKALLIFGVGLNVAVLGYFKYTNFLVDNFNAVFGASWQVARVILPLGISFFTFQKIAFLVDSYRGETKRYSLLDFCLFVFFFPQLIAGPIVHHSEIITQLQEKDVSRWQHSNFSLGLAVFILGLFKKVCIADAVAVYAKPVFDAAGHSTSLTFLEAWGGVLAYTFQLYFDFSGYSDMAIGLGLLFNIRLPLNFDSPYKATSIVDFWRRWHMTLSRFLRDYVYIGLGGNRRGEARRQLNLMATMLIGGLWHGANWTFVIWGGLHGLFLSVNHWLGGREKRPPPTGLRRFAAIAVTFFCVTLTWVLFRADSLAASGEVFKGLFGFNGLVVPDHFAPKMGSLAGLVKSLGASFGQVPLFKGVDQTVQLLLCAVVVWGLPNTAEWFGLKPGTVARWKPTALHAVILGLLFGLAIMGLNKPSEFLYFQF